MRGRRELRDRFVGTLLIVLGASVIAGFGSAFAALGYLASFSVALAVGHRGDVPGVPASGPAGDRVGRDRGEPFLEPGLESTDQAAAEVADSEARHCTSVGASAGEPAGSIEIHRSS